MRATVTSIASVYLTLLLATAALAQPHTVLPGQSIQAAIDAAANGDTILVEAGRYNESLNLRGKRITLRSIRGPHVTFIDGENLSNSVIRCVSGETSATVIEGFTITDGAGSPEYAFTRGGGLLVRCSNPTIRSCIFENNAAGDFGGGAYVIGETLALSPCPAGATFEDCTFRHNTAGRGAGLSTYFADTRLERCAFHGNQAGSEGGGLRINGGETTVVSCEFVGNAANRGGAVFLANTTPAAASTSIVGCTITANIGRIARGGLQIDIPITVANTILHGDTAPEIFSFDPASTSVRHCLVAGGFAGTGNITGNPLFRRTPSPGPDGAWGTGDDDFGDLRLQAGSPCLDRADSAAAVAANANTDAHNCPRDVNDPGAPDGGAGASPTVDLGAHERRAPIIVNNTSIQAAINAAEPCDEIILRPGTYNEPVNFLGKPIIVRGESTPDQTVLSGTGLATSIVRFVTGETSQARLENVTIRGSRGLCEGGGVRIAAASPTLVNCRITDNISACPFDDNWAAGVFIQGGAPSLIECEIDNNVVGNDDFATFGAGLYAEDAALVITDSRFHGNITDNFFGSFSLGGGVCHFGPMLCILDSSFSDNLADSNGLGPGNGGAAIFSEANRLEVLRCTFTDNYVGENTFGAGGAIWHVGGAALLEDCTFLRNHVGSGGGGQGHGGAIALDAGDVFHCSFITNEATTSRGGLGGAAAVGDADFHNCFFIGNEADGEEVDGGGAIAAFGDVRVTDSTFQFNTAFTDGGAIALREGSLTVRTSAFSSNGGDEGGAIHLATGVADISAHFTANTASRGGAIYNAGAVCTLSGCTFIRNVGCGGALWTTPSTSVQNCLFDRNFPDHIQGPFNNLGGNEGLPYSDLDRDTDIDIHDLLAYLDLWFNANAPVESLLAYLDCWFAADPFACPGRPAACN